MRRLDRSKLVEPPEWAADRHKRLDGAAYLAKAATFEALPWDSAERRPGFTVWDAAHPPPVLPKERGKPAFPANWRDSAGVKPSLQTWTSDLCAYCESSLTDDSAAQVEHFRPKAQFPSLAYDFSNYYPACGACNGAKSSKWPRAGAYLRPDACDPEKEFAFADDGSMRAVGGADADSTRKDLRLDRRGLRVARKMLIALLLDAFRKSTVDPALRREWLRLQWSAVSTPGVAYSMALRAAIRREWEAVAPGEAL